MKNTLFIILSLLTLAGASYIYLNLSGKTAFVSLFTCGFLLGIFLMNLIVNVKDEKLKNYKRKLEKESVSSDENSSKIKVLESKIQVLEKALENALKNS